MNLFSRTRCGRRKIIPAILGVIAPVILMLIFVGEVKAQETTAPTADFSTTHNQQYITFTDTSADPDNEITQWYWDVGDGTHYSMEQTFAHEYRYGGTYNVRLEVVDETGLRNALVRDVVVEGPQPAAPEAYFYFTINDYIVEFQDSSSDADHDIVWYYWNLGDGTHITQEETLTHTYNRPGTYSATLVVFDSRGNSSQITRDVVVYDDNATPTADFTYTINNNEVTFTDASADSNTQITELYWDLGDGTHHAMETAISHTYLRGGSYTVKLEVVNDWGYRDTVEKTIEIAPVDLPNPEAYFTEYIESGSYTISYYDQSTSPNGEITQWYWDMGDGNHYSMTENVTHTYATNGTYRVTLEVVDEYGERATYQGSFTIRGESRGTPDAYFSVYNDQETNTVTVYDQSTSPNGEIVERYWDFGDGNFSTDERVVEHIYTESRIYTIELEVVDILGERDTYSLTLEV